MSFVGIEINNSKVTKISGNTIVSASKDSVFLSRLCGGELGNVTVKADANFLSRLCGGE